MFKCSSCTGSLLRAVLAGSTLPPISASAVLSCRTGSILRAPGRGLTTGLPDDVASPALEEHAFSDNRRAVRASVNKRHLSKELTHLRDPVDIAARTLQLLNQNNVEKALGLVQLAGKDRQCTVSWNHIIDHEMNQGRTASALKIYNDMKKRAHIPDAYTYTILLRGFAKNAEMGKIRNAEAALKIYHSMFNEGSPVEPSVIHSNAMLNVCAKALDMDSLFSVAARLPGKGPGAPNSVSYTIILHAVRMAALQPMRNETDEQKFERRQQAVFQGRRIWADIIDRWRENTIVVDEKLVCAMGGLLSLGNMEHDADDVLSLVEQTMRIPRLVPRVGDPKRQTHLHVKALGKERGNKTTSYTEEQSVSEVFLGDAAGPPDGSVMVQVKDEDSLVTTDSSEFTPLPPSKIHRLYPIPGCNTLSLVLLACSRIYAFAPAQQYWDLFTSKLQPDSDNYHTYLRLLRTSRSSRLAVDLVADMIRTKKDDGLEVGVAAKTFFIAMSACKRNDNNIWALKSGNRLLSLMRSSLQEPDVDTMVTFANLLTRSGQRWPIQEVITAADILFELFSNLRSLYAFGRLGGEPKSNKLLFRPAGDMEGEDAAEDIDPVASEEVSAERARHREPGEKVHEDPLAKGQIGREERGVLKQLGRRLEAAFGHVLQVYGDDLAHSEKKKMTEYRYRVRDWIFRREHRSEEGIKYKAGRSYRDKVRFGRVRMPPPTVQEGEAQVAAS